MKDAQVSGIDNARRIGLFGGTFDPVHTGHLIIAEAVRQQAGLDVVLFIPSANPPHKNHELMFDAVKRYDMVNAVTAGNPHFAVSDIELRREGPSFTIDTVRQVKADIPAGAELHFIVGKDNLFEMSLWKNPQGIVDQLTSVLVADRLIDEISDVPDWFADKVRMIQVPLIEISSSDIRRRIKAGESIRYMVPPEVEDAVAGQISSER